MTRSKRGREEDVAHEPLIDADRLRATVAQTTALLEKNPGGGMIRPSVEARLVRNVAVDISWEQFGHEFALRSDEPAGRGGGSAAPTAIRYFLAGIASCLQVWFAKGAALTGCDLVALTLRVEASLDMRVEYGLSPSGLPENILARAIVESVSPDEVVLAMSEEAFRRCPLWQIVTRGMPGYRQIVRDGRLILDSAPSDGAASRPGAGST